MTAQRPDSTDTSRITLAHYERSAQGFWEGTRHHDVSQNIAAMLQHASETQALSPLIRPRKLRILDVGCGPGRDLKTFIELGHTAVGLEGCAAFVEMAREYAGCEVLHQDFLNIALPPASFDAVFANASLFHVPSSHIKQVLTALKAGMKPGGVLFSSNPRGNDDEGWDSGEIGKGRYGVWYQESTWRGIMAAVGFVELAHYYRPAGRPREQQPWFASVWQNLENLENLENSGSPK